MQPFPSRRYNESPGREDFERKNERFKSFLKSFQGIIFYKNSQFYRYANSEKLAAVELQKYSVIKLRSLLSLFVGKETE